MKIFKYTIINGKTLIPKDARILRIAHVDDGFYKGDFLWAIVDPEEKEMKEFIWDGGMYSAAPHPNTTAFKFPLKVKEKQVLKIKHFKMICAGEVDGQIYLHGNSCKDHEEEYNIAMYKTGQLIDLPVEKLEYLGLNRLWIVQELGLYAFRVLP